MRLHKWDGGIQDHWYEDSLEGGSGQGGKLSQLAAHHWPGPHWKTREKLPQHITDLYQPWIFFTFLTKSGFLDWYVLLYWYDPRASWRDYQEPLRIPHKGKHESVYLTKVNMNSSSFESKARTIIIIQDGRISMAGVTSGNVGHLAKAMHDVTK